MKKFLIILIIIVALIVGGGVALLSSVNTLLVKAVNTYGPELTQTSVHLDKADISFLDGKGTLQGLTIGNPVGFKGQNAFTLDTIYAELDTGTLTDDVVIIQRIDMAAPHILYERTLTSDNIQTIIRNIKAVTQSGSTPQATDQPASKAGSTRVKINELVIRDGTISLMLPGIDKTINLALPEIRLQNIGGDQGHATVADVAVLILQRIADAALNAATSTGSGAKALLSGTGATLGNKTETIVRDTGSALGGKLNDVTQQFGTLLGK